MTTFFSADHHFDHEGIIKLSKRPFADVTEMNRELIARHNAVVTNYDDVYFIGDVRYNKWTRGMEAAKAAVEHISKLNFKTLYIIPGNHEKAVKTAFEQQLLGSAWSMSLNRDVRLCPPLVELNINRQSITLCHYALRTWNKCHYGAWHLYGHSHGSLRDDPQSLSFDVGVDCHNFYPLSLDDVAKKMALKTFKPVDHHAPRTS